MRRRPYLIPPGTRKNNKYYIIRGNFDGKHDKEESTGTADEELANSMLETIIYQESIGQHARDYKTFDYAADQYIAWRNPSEREQGFINEMRKYFYDIPISEITQSDFVACANTLYQGKKGSSKNRAVMRPASAIIHYAAKPSHKWCDYWQIELFDEATVEKRTMKFEDAQRLVNAVEGKKKLLLLWFFKHSDRVSSTLAVEGRHIHPEKGYYERLTGKRIKRWTKAPLDPEVKEALENEFKDGLPEGRIFHYPSRWAVYRAFKSVCKRLKIKFTPHMARHSILSWIGDAGGNSIQIKTRAGHASLKSSEPYLAENLDITRDITARFALVKKTPIRGTLGEIKRRRSKK